MSTEATEREREPLTPERQAFALRTSEALRAWDEADSWQRLGVHALCPALGEALDAASEAVDELLDVEGDEHEIDLHGSVSDAATAARFPADATGHDSAGEPAGDRYR